MAQPGKNNKEENKIIISESNIVMSEEMSNYEFKMPTSILLDRTDEDLVIKWTKFKQQFKTFLLAAGLEQKSENRKAAILLNCLGEQVQDLYYNVLNGSDDNQKYTEVTRILDDYFLNKQNEIIQTFKFNNRNQVHGESFDAYLSDLKKMIKQCNFGALEDRMLRDKLVMGISDEKVRKKLLEDNNLTMDKAVTICRAAEASEAHSKIFNDKNKEHIQAIDVLQRKVKSPHNVKTKQVDNKTS